jgi:crotonobetainyl-CoA:carnitine CoA-transferase CaiB-like acyl-CoA transferase
LCAALRITAALLERSQSPAPMDANRRWLDVAMLDGLIGMQQAQFAQVVAEAPPVSILTGGAPAYQFYRCADGGYVSVGALEPQFMKVLAAETGGDLSAAALSALFLSAPRDAWTPRLAGACVVPVLSPAEVAAHPQVRARGLFTPEGLPASPTGPVGGRVPALGEANAEAERGWPAFPAPNAP